LILVEIDCNDVRIWSRFDSGNGAVVERLCEGLNG